MDVRVNSKFSQPAGFQTKSCSCPACAQCAVTGWCLGGKVLNAHYPALYQPDGAHVDIAGGYTAYFYPNDATTQYLYESYPQIVKASVGVKNEHFINWMRTAALSQFRKLYATINDDLDLGDVVTIHINNNFNVAQFGGSKSIVLTTASWWGGANNNLGNAFIIVGALCLGVAVVATGKNLINPRKLADKSYLKKTN